MINKIFSFIWHRRLLNEFTGKYDAVIKVKGWRTVLVENAYGARQTISFCFWWFK